ncbi:CBS domain-containing protein [Pleionea sediminis]|uniref:CBS domain-containing protein n=1 Tax=Pleionea sediminis TaxID=2569479 RepID=UPI001186149D|nr:CBS domain-containing protein [Pleionea sediminis]
MNTHVKFNAKAFEKLNLTKKQENHFLTKENLYDYLTHPIYLVDSVNIDPETLVDEALLIFSRTHSHIGLVTNTEGQLFGVVSIKQLKSRKVLQQASRANIPRSDMTISQIMTPLSQLLCVDGKTFKEISGEELAVHLAHLDVDYLLVINEDKRQLVGLIDRTELENKVGITIPRKHKPRSFAEIVDNVLHH